MKIIYLDRILMSSIMFLTFLPIITFSVLSAMGALIMACTSRLNTKSLVIVFKKSCYRLRGWVISLAYSGEQWQFDEIQ